MHDSIIRLQFKYALLWYTRILCMYYVGLNVCTYIHVCICICEWVHADAQFWHASYELRSKCATVTLFANNMEI